jgi:hypothetical protein
MSRSRGAAAAKPGIRDDLADGVASTWIPRQDVRVVEGRGDMSVGMRLGLCFFARAERASGRAVTELPVARDASPACADRNDRVGFGP